MGSGTYYDSKQYYTRNNLGDPSLIRLANRLKIDVINPDMMNDILKTNQSVVSESTNNMSSDFYNTRSVNSNDLSDNILADSEIEDKVQA